MLATISSELYYQLLFVNDATQVSGAQEIMVYDIVQVSHEISTNKMPLCYLWWVMPKFCHFATTRDGLWFQKDAFIMTATTLPVTSVSNMTKQP